MVAAALPWLALQPARAADAAFTQFIASLWPEAQAAGVSRAMFDAETRGLEPDYKLPDLILPGRPATGAPSQAEFVQVPADYVKEATIARLAAEGQRLMAEASRGALRDRIALRRARHRGAGDLGPRNRLRPLLLPYDGLRVLATQAYVGRRKDQYRTEFIQALKLIGDGAVTRKDLRSSWAGATGLTQFLPSELDKHGVDFDGDGRSRHLAFGAGCARFRRPAARQQGLAAGRALGLRSARARWCRLHHGCARSDKTDREWLREGFVPVRGKSSARPKQAQPASLLQPEGIYGPAFLTTKNYFVIKEYNFSDLYVLFVGHLCDRMVSPQPFATPWSASKQLRTTVGRSDAAPPHAGRSLQRQARRQGRHEDPRRAWGVPEIGRAEGRLLAERSGAARDQRGALIARMSAKRKTRPKGRASDSSQPCWTRRSDQSQTSTRR